MGCNSSKDVMNRIKEQEKKIDDLIEINKALEQRVKSIASSPVEIRNSNDTGDLTTLKTTIDNRFSKLERTVEKIHNEFKLKVFDGIADNLDDGPQRPIDMNKSLSLNFDRDKGDNKRPPETQWNDLLHDSHITPKKVQGQDVYTYPNEVKLELRDARKGPA